jgi:hypothetical protein
MAWPPDARGGRVPYLPASDESPAGEPGAAAAGGFRPGSPVPYHAGMRSLWSPMLALAMAIVLAVTVTSQHGRRHHHAPAFVFGAR